MSPKPILVAAPNLALLLAACATPEAVDIAAETASLRAAASAYQEAASAKDAATVVGMYDPEAVMIPPSGELVQGIEEVRAYRFGFIETPDVALEFELLRVVVAQGGDLGWTLARGLVTVARPGEAPARDVIRDFHTWRKQPDGTWKITADVWNSGPAPGG